MPACPATVTLWGRFRRQSPKAALYVLPVHPLQAWLPTWAHTAVKAEAESLHGGLFPVRLEVQRRWLADKWPETVAQLESGTPRRVLTERLRLVVTRESLPAQDLVFGFDLVLRDSNLPEETASVVLGLTLKQVRLLACGYLRVQDEGELQRVESALREEVQRQARVSGVPIQEG